MVKIKNTECLVIGDLNIDLIFRKLNRFPELGDEVIAKDHKMTVGGSGAIFACILSNLGIKTSIISKIGNDQLGKYLIGKMKLNGVDTSRVIIANEEETGITVNLSFQKDKSQISSINLIKSLEFEDLKMDGLNDLKHVHFSSYFLMEGLKSKYIEIIKMLKNLNGGITFSLDTNDDPSNEWDEEIYNILKSIDILLLNKKEALKISREKNISKAIEKLGSFAGTVVIKLGRDGGVARKNNIDYRGYCKNTDNLNFKDSTGAGDNFDAGFIYGFLKKYDINKSLELAMMYGEKSIKFTGGVPDDKGYKFEQ